MPGVKQSAKTRDLANLCCERNPAADKMRGRIARLLKAGADIHATDKNGVTLLHHAVRFRSPATVELLLQRGANVNQQCKRSGSTPLHRAVTWSGAPATASKSDQAREIIEILLRHGADPSIKNKLGKQPADYVRDPKLRQLLTKKRLSGRNATAS
jgi:tankyrase